MIGCLFASDIAHAVEDVFAGAPMLIYLRPPETSETDDKLLHYLDAHLSSTFTVIEEDAPAAIDRPLTELAVVIRALIATREASAAVWLTQNGRKLMVLAPELSSSPWAVSVSNETPGSSNWCESTAILVRSDLAPLLPPPMSSITSNAPSVSVPTTTDARSVPAPRTTTDEAVSQQGSFADGENEVMNAPPSKPRPKKPPTPARTRKKRSPKYKQTRLFRPIRLDGAVGYAPSWQSTSNAFHGVWVALKLDLGFYLSVSVEGILAQRASLRAFEHTITFQRWPLTAVLHANLPLRRFVLAAGLGCVWAPTHLRNLPQPPEDLAATQIQHPWGATAELSIDYWLLSRLGFRVKGRIDIFTDEVNLTVENAAVLRINRVGGALLLGIAGRINLTGDTEK